jgi:hypothetical protein
MQKISLGITGRAKGEKVTVVQPVNESPSIQGNLKLSIVFYLLYCVLFNDALSSYTTQRRKNGHGFVILEEFVSKLS